MTSDLATVSAVSHSFAAGPDIRYDCEFFHSAMERIHKWTSFWELGISMIQWVFLAFVELWIVRKEKPIQVEVNSTFNVQTSNSSNVYFPIELDTNIFKSTTYTIPLQPFVNFRSQLVTTLFQINIWHRAQLSANCPAIKSINKIKTRIEWFYYWTRISWL